MEHYTTQKARTSPLVWLAEILLVAALTVWCAACVAVIIQRVRRGLEPSDIYAFLVVMCVPLLVDLLILRRRYFRRKARAVAGVLVWETEDFVTWELLEQHGDVRNLRRAIATLYAHKYLRNITPEANGLKLRRPAPGSDGMYL